MIMKNNIEIGQRIKHARLKAKLNQEELGKKLGVHKSTVSRWEKGIVDNINLATVSKLSEVLKVSEAWLSGKDVPMELPDIAKYPGIKNIHPLPKSRRFPVIGAIACGTPIEAVEEYAETLDFPDEIDADVLLRCRGDSMTPAYHDGDYVFIRRQPTVENGQIAAVYVKDGAEWDATLKKVIMYPEKNMIVLRPLNADYEDMIFTGEERADLEVFGIAVAIYRKV